VVGHLEEGRQITWMGVRDGKGEKTPATEVIEGYLLSALLRHGVALVLADSAVEKWSADEIVPLDGQRDWVMGGRLQGDSPWMYVRLLLVDGGSGQVLSAHTRRVAEQRVLEEVARHARKGEVAVQGGTLGVDLHLLVRRSEGGSWRRVALEEGGILQQGDQVQIRFTTSRDVEAYAFLYGSEGQVQEVFAPQFVYSGMKQYGPGEGQWISLNEIDQVHTLYFLAGPHLLEDRAEEFFARLAELVEQGQVERFTGLEKLDQVLVEFLLRAYQDNPVIQVQRGAQSNELGPRETIVLEDGTRLESQAEAWQGRPVVARALSFAVQ
jgi:hypothetical protein